MKPETKWIIFFAVVAVVIATMQLVGVYFSLYWLLPWFDIPMHMIAGFWVGMAGYAIFSIYSCDRIISSRWQYLYLFLFVLSVGVAWEIFEFDTNLTSLSFGRMPYFVDTIKDIIDDSIGGLLSIWYLKRIRFSVLK